ncbi:MAG: alpha/beta fold hydrolase [Alphaproteobacteria bacterium]
MTPPVVDLAHEDWGGEGATLLVLHGLFGSGRNWQRVGRRLTDRRRVVGVHLRNHGASPWSETMTYEAMAADVLALMDRLGLERADIVGHSMGGKAAMVAALTAPARVGRLAVVDIAPVPYDHSHRLEIDAMAGLDLAAIGARADADAALAPTLPDASLRAFLLQNLASTPAGYRWRINLDGIDRHMDDLTDFPPLDDVYEGPVLLLSGGRSDYVDDAGRRAMRTFFPNTRFAHWPDAGHWPHVEHPDATAELLCDFLAEPARSAPSERPA